MIFYLLGGVIVAAGVFAAFLWSLYQGFVPRGVLQISHIAAASLTLSAMASLSLLIPLLASLSGVLLAISAGVAFVSESGWNRLLPVFQIVFAIILVLGLPFNA